MNFKKRTFLDSIVGLASLFMIWELLYLMIDRPVIPEPFETVYLFFVTFPSLLPHIFASFYRILMAILISLCISVPAGIVIGSSQRLNRLLSPVLYLIYPIPKVAFLPVFMLLYGLGDTSKIILIVWIIVFQLVLSVRDGIMQISPAYRYVFTMMHAEKLQQFRYLLIPAILPQIISGLRICIGIAIASLFFAENYVTKYGLGYYIMNAWSVIDYPTMFCGILALCLLGLLFFTFLDMLEKWFVPWQNV